LKIKLMAGGLGHISVACFSCAVGGGEVVDLLNLRAEFRRRVKEIDVA
jgi:hypothetical protein